MSEKLYMELKWSEFMIWVTLYRKWDLENIERDILKDLIYTVRNRMCLTYLYAPSTQYDLSTNSLIIWTGHKDYWFERNIDIDMDSNGIVHIRTIEV